ncbi:hypothetical protein OPU71_12285 [Niveibacterium sp. 24ML]|uniref:hypothetical protein n=1 Tax=Niveibacterium sp. 24ML TaxID=2985512 RepID=UPI00226DD647|nr:hypothetical protein [Niveibacterium sp. 24ML]MCX9156904.1 hypothetical protein [Niveibacterium sp. 24ML]
MMTPNPRPFLFSADKAPGPLLRVSDHDLMQAMRAAELHEHELADPFDDEDGEDAGVSWIA